MRLRVKPWPRGGMPVIAASFAGKPGALAGRVLSWPSLGAALVGIMLAKWTWALLAPASPAMPPAAWEASDDAARLFGTARIADAQPAAPISNVKLVGVFAHRTKGFAVMQVDDKQIGVAQGEEVKPGLKLVETHADHVILEQGGVRQRVDMTGASAPGGVVTGPGTPVLPPAAITAPPPTPVNADQNGASPAVPPGQISALQQQLDAAGNLPPERREMLQRQLDRLRGQH